MNVAEQEENQFSKTQSGYSQSTSENDNRSAANSLTKQSRVIRSCSYFEVDNVPEFGGQCHVSLLLLIRLVLQRANEQAKSGSGGELH